MASELDHSPSPSINGSNTNSAKRSSRSAESSAESTRNRRFLANLQATLGGTGKSQNSSPRRGNKPRNFGRNVLPKTVDSLEEALRLINLSEDDVCASLMDVKPFLQCNSADFNDEEFVQISLALCDAALHQSNIYFVIDICVTLIEFKAFQQAMSDCLKRKTTEFLKDEGGESANVPHFLAQLMVAKWPRKFNRIQESSNVILYTVFNTIIGWVNFLHTKLKEDLADSEIEAIFEHCAQGMILFCNTGQRFIWMNFPELYDQIFNVIVELLTKDSKLPSSVKCSLLQLHISMNKWSLANLPKYSNAQTQTVNLFF
ncbi:hypothetical protein niasHT_007371 [Heterodera trifolii]|uniref:DUF7627 domain-containing protein n=1 Tax=Heterodera trifolii TaxID=157864 RepID=A0ABD2LLG2_9BILA